MRTKQLLMAAMALPMAFAACTNDEIVEMNNVSQLESEKIIGEKLIADGAYIKLADDAESRVTGTKFDVNDKLGMAWFNNPDPINGDGTITGAQNLKNFSGATNFIYNNHLAQLNEEGVFAINGEIYAGAHFIYYPYKNIGLGKELVVDYAAKNHEYKQVNTVSGDSQIKDEIMTNALHVSHKEILSASDPFSSDFKLNFNAAPINVMNAFVVQPTLEKSGDAYLKAQGLLKDIVITEMSIEATQKIFASKATIYPSQLSEKATNKDKTFNSEKTKELVTASLFDADPALNIEGANRTKTIKTGVAYENNLGEEKLSDIIAYTFPISTPTPALTDVTVKITTNVGSFNYKCNDEKLLRLLNGVESDGTTPVNPNFAIACGGYRKIPMKLDLANLSLGKSANGPAAWNLLMKLYEATGVETIPTISVSNMTFTNDIPMYLPEGKDVVAKGDITFEGNQTIPGALTVTKKITVAEGATLTIGTEDVIAEEIVVNGTLTLNESVQATTITNNGTINVNADLSTDNFNNNAEATVNVAKDIVIKPLNTAAYTNAGTINIKGTINGTVDNTGEIVVTYNEAQVDHTGAGIVRGVLDATEGTGFIAEDDQVLAIYQMIDGTNSKVKCNALELIGFNLTEGDQYEVWGSDPLIFTADKFSLVDVKLVNSTLQATSTFSFDELELDGSTITGNISATKLDASNNSVVTGTIQTAGAITANALTVTGDVQATGDVTLTASAVTGNVTGAAITLASTEVEGNVTGTGAVALTGTTVTGDVTSTGNLTIDNSTVTGELNVYNSLIIKNNSTVTATTASSAGITAENSTLVGSFNAGAANVVLTNCTIQYNEVASMITTTGDLTITADAVAFNIYNTDINAKDVTFAGKKGVVLHCSRVTAADKCNVSTKVTHRSIKGLTNESTINADDINVAVGASLGAGIVANEI